jgi:hypothetical protein
MPDMRSGSTLTSDRNPRCVVEIVRNEGAPGAVALPASMIDAQASTSRSSRTRGRATVAYGRRRPLRPAEATAFRAIYAHSDALRRNEAQLRPCSTASPPGASSAHGRSPLSSATRTDPASLLGAYVLPGRVDDPRPGIAQAKAGERTGLGSIWVSERWDTKELGVMCGALSQAIERPRIDHDGDRQWTSSSTGH